MQTITRDVMVNAPLEKVFEFLVSPHNLAMIWPGIVDIKGVKKAKNSDGFKFNWEYRMSGVQFEGKCETIEHRPPERLVIKSTKGLDSTVAWTLTGLGQLTKVTLEFAYQIPALVLKQMEADTVDQANEREIQEVLQNLKERLELEPARA